MRRVTLLLIILILPSLIGASSHQPDILLIYGNTDDQTHIEPIINNFDVNLQSISIDELSPSDIGDQDQIIFVGSTEFSTDDDVELALESYLSDPDHHFLAISPYLDEFTGSLETALGIDDYEEAVFSESNNIEWTISSEVSFANYTISDTFSYTGIAGMVTLESNAQTMASFTSVNGDDDVMEDVELPRPAMWNYSQAASIYVVPIALDSQASEQLGLSQASDFISTILRDLIISSIVELPGVEGTDPSGDGTSNDGSGDGPSILPQDLDFITPELGLVAALIALLALFYSKVVGAIQWLMRKGYGLMIAVIGAFYNIQDRTLTHSEVVMNSSRTDILAYLNHVGAYGSHLREIKNITDLGSGSLLWHLQVLEDYGMIDKFSLGSYTIFVADGYTFDFELKEIELKLQSKYTLDLLDVLAHTSDMTLTLSEIEHTTGINRRPLRRLLKKMADEELVVIEKYPEMSIVIQEHQMIQELFHSFNLRDSFTFDRENPQVEYID